MGRTALYRDPAPFRPARAEIQLDHDVLVLVMPDGRQRRHLLDGYAATRLDGFVGVRVIRPLPEWDRALHGVSHAARPERRFVRMLILEREHERHVIITPPDRGAVAPNVVRLPEAPDDAAIVDEHAWDAFADWMGSGGRFTGCSIADLARLAAIASPQFAALIGEVAAQRALELVAVASGPLRGVSDPHWALRPLIDAARYSQRVGEAVIAALSHLMAGASHAVKPSR